MALNLAQYRRPGIFIEEIDNAIQQVPVQETIINLVPGFSKKGPPNRPVLVSSSAEIRDTFGSIDRNLEKKGSYFHRTMQQIISQAPVFGLNLLLTDDTLDLLEWKSLSTSSSTPNGSNLKDPYSNFFNRNDFWVRDTEQFLDVAQRRSNVIDKILHITNFSDEKRTVFVFKSPINGFDVTAEDYYGGRDKVPSWMYPSDLISDYMVRMLVIGGDWTNYASLAVDPKWGRFFNINGLRKDQTSNFINDPSVTLFNQYDVALIPYFRDQNGTDFFIETVVNRDTEENGIFVAFDIDSLETDEPNGLVDLIGHTLVDEDVSTTDFLSYKELIDEAVDFEEKPLDVEGNVFGRTLNYETRWLTAPDLCNIVPSDDSSVATTGVSTVGLQNDAEIILNGTKVTLATGQQVEIPDVAPGKIRRDTIYTDSIGQIGIISGVEVSNFTDWENVPLRPISGLLHPIAIVEVGTAQNDVGGSGTSGTTYPGVANCGAVKVLDNLTFADSGTAGGDVIISTVNAYTTKIIFANTKASDPDVEYKKSRARKMYDNLVANLNTSESIIKTNTGNDRILEIEQTNNSAENLAIQITISTSKIIDYPVEIYYTNDAFTIGSLGLRNDPASSSYGQVSANSDFYEAYRDGVINSGDFFLQNIANNGSTIPAIQFKRDNIGQSVITMWSTSPLFTDDDQIDAQGGDKIYFAGTENNDAFYTLLSAEIDLPGSYSLGAENYLYRSELIVSETITPEVLQGSNVTVHDGNPDSFVYLKLYTINGALYADFVNSADLETAGQQEIEPAKNKNLKVFSRRSNFKQTLEVEAVLETNRFLVNASRYGEVVVGDYVKAFVEEDLEPGFVPKKFSRIISKQVYAPDPSLTVLSTDLPVDFINFDGDRQTTRYTSIDSYVSTYKGISLSGFKIRQESKPDGTNARQNAILNLLAPGTPIFKGLTNRNRISWRYLVDSFGGGLQGNSKQQLVDLCGERLNVLGLLNMPSAKAFKDSTNPNFKNSNGQLDPRFVRLGGDPQSNPSFLYTFGQGAGQTNVAYFFPWVTINDLGRPLDVPPAMFIANTFMRKHTSRRSDVYPWTIAAGLTNGRVTGFGDVEIDITDNDLEEYNTMGSNVILFRRNEGFVIGTNNTAQAVPQTPLSSTHVREALIEIENDIYNILLGFQWRFNTPETRLEIKRIVDRALTRYESQDAIADFFTVADSTNNTNEVIDARTGVIDVYVEPVQGLETLVNRITILRTGAIEAGGFLPTA